MIALHPIFVGPTLGTGLVSSLDNASSMTVDAVVSPSAHMRAQVINGAYMGISMQVSGTISSTIRGRVTAGATLSNVPRPELRRSRAWARDVRCICHSRAANAGGNRVGNYYIRTRAYAARYIWDHIGRRRYDG